MTEFVMLSDEAASMMEEKNLHLFILGAVISQFDFQVAIQLLIVKLRAIARLHLFWVNLMLCLWQSMRRNIEYM